MGSAAQQEGCREMVSLQTGFRLWGGDRAKARSLGSSSQVGKVPPPCNAGVPCGVLPPTTSCLSLGSAGWLFSTTDESCVVWAGACGVTSTAKGKAQGEMLHAKMHTFQIFKK